LALVPRRDRIARQAEDGVLRALDQPIKALAFLLNARSQKRMRESIAVPA
jgi:hypothetical protein